MNFSKGSEGNTLSFPLTQNAIDNLSPSKLASPRVGNKHNLSLPTSFNDLKSLSEEIERVRAEISRNEFPRWFLEKYYPSVWGTFPEEIPEVLAREKLSYKVPQTLADVVHMDNPIDLGLAMHSWLLSKGYKVKNKTTVGHNEFLDNVCDVVRNLSLELTSALDKAFEAKYYFGVARPEEILGYNLTHYPEGCPTHPSYPAGHGAVAGATGKYFLDAFELDDYAIEQIRVASYVWAQARSFAGVHYAEDNVAGLIIGGLI